MDRLRVATVWLDGCSGCHMSLLDIDERLLLLAERIELVYSPLVDAKVFPENVDLAILNTSEAWTVDPEKFLSKARNTPFGGWHVTGRPLATVIGSTLVFSRIH